MERDHPHRLLGSWKLERVINDLNTGKHSTASGLLRLELVRSGLITWVENVVLRLGDSELDAYRRLRLEADEAGPDELNLWHVHFEDGRYFHPWTPGETVIHPCGADLYEGIVDLGDTTKDIRSWHVTWRVRGPGKSLVIETGLSRAPDWDDRL